MPAERGGAPAVVLLLGAGGTLGLALAARLGDIGTVTALDRRGVDLADAVALRDVVRGARPSLIVNAAAYTAVDGAESAPAEAEAVNAAAPGVLAEEAERMGACLVHYSTDYVFDGRKGAPYVETDEAAPLSVYGRTKRRGERLVERHCTRRLLLRTSWVFGSDGYGFPARILAAAAEREALRVVADQRGAPTSATLIADVTVRALRAMQGARADDPRWGTYHVTASGETTWCAYAQRVLAAGHRAGLPLKAQAEDVVPVTTTEYPAAAARPLDSRLDTGKLRRTFDLTLPEWTRDVDAALERLTRQLQHPHA